MRLRRFLSGILFLAVAAFAGSCARDRLKSVSRLEAQLNLRRVDGGTAIVSENQLNFTVRNMAAQRGELVRLFDTSGNEVQVEKSEIENALALLLHSQKKHFSDLSINGDSSVTLVSPRFVYRDRESIPLVAEFREPNPQAEDAPPARSETLHGLCRHFGFARFLMSEEYATDNSYRTENEALGNPGAILKSSGEISKYFSNAYSASYLNERNFSFFYNVVHAVTCTERLQ